MLNMHLSTEQSIRLSMPGLTGTSLLVPQLPFSHTLAKCNFYLYTQSWSTLMSRESRKLFRDQSWLMSPSISVSLSPDISLHIFKHLKSYWIEDPSQEEEIMPS